VIAPQGTPTTAYAPVYAQGDPGKGIGGYDLKSRTDRGITGTGTSAKTIKTPDSTIYIIRSMRTKDVQHSTCRGYHDTTGRRRGLTDSTSRGKAHASCWIVPRASAKFFSSRLDSRPR
jgi:hypothetical protein